MPMVARLAGLLLAAAVVGAVTCAAVLCWVWPTLFPTVGLGPAFGLGRQATAPSSTTPLGLLRVQSVTVSAAALCLLVAALSPLAWWVARVAMAPWRRMMSAVDGALLRYQDGDFSTSIAVHGHGELARFGRLHNALGDTLRRQRQQLAQRELVLDTVVQHTPIAMVLTNDAGRVVYANLAARQLLHRGRKLDGAPFADVLQDQPEPLREAVRAAQDGLFTVPSADRTAAPDHAALPRVVSPEAGVALGAGEPPAHSATTGATSAVQGSEAPADGEEHFHLAVRTVQLQGRPHRLHLLRRMTRELARQEVASWKRVIRVLSHELNNSLAPISSMAHSGAELARRGAIDRLPGVFAGIAERAGHLHGFVAGYAEFARLPAPRRSAVDWGDFVASLRAHSAFRLVGGEPDTAAQFDAGQVAQAVTNLLRNAHESGSTVEAVTLSIRLRGDRLRIEVTDAGTGMSEAVRAQAVLPFYSTKRAGTGLGLALAREIAEAHGGRLLLANGSERGTVAAIDLPMH